MSVFKTTKGSICQPFVSLSLYFEVVYPAAGLEFGKTVG